VISTQVLQVPRNWLNVLPIIYGRRLLLVEIESCNDLPIGTGTIDPQSENTHANDTGFEPKKYINKEFLRLFWKKKNNGWRCLGAIRSRPDRTFNL